MLRRLMSASGRQTPCTVNVSSESASLPQKRHGGFRRRLNGDRCARQSPLRGLRLAPFFAPNPGGEMNRLAMLVEREVSAS